MMTRANQINESLGGDGDLTVQETPVRFDEKSKVGRRFTSPIYKVSQCEGWPP